MQQINDLLSYGFLDLAINSIVYFVVALPFFLIFWKFYQSKFQKRRIQEIKRSTPNLIRFEIKNSIITLLIFTLIDVLIYVAKLNGLTQLYDKVDEYGWEYLLFSIVILLLFHDTWFYFTHRLMHHPKLFKHIHKVHHVSTDPSPFASLSFHPLEALLEAGVYGVVAFLFPVHLLALFAWQIFQIVMNEFVRR